MAEPLFSFGIIADVQYADIDDAMNYTRTRKRFYRGSAELLRNAARHWRQERVQFVVQLGDVIDGQNRWRGASESALEAVLREFDAIPAPVHHVWGNHEFYNFNRETLIASRLNSAPRNASGSDLIDKDIYAYAFSPAPGFRFVLLDAFDLSVIGRAKESEKHQRALRTLRENNHNLHDFNQPPGEQTAENPTAHTNSTNPQENPQNQQPATVVPRENCISNVLYVAASFFSPYIYTLLM